MLFVVGSAEENEILLFNAVLALRDSLNILLKTSVDRRTIIENYVGLHPPLDINTSYSCRNRTLFASQSMNYATMVGHIRPNGRPHGLLIFVRCASRDRSNHDCEPS